jgi:hypothetical protein
VSLENAFALIEGHIFLNCQIAVLFALGPKKRSKYAQRITYSSPVRAAYDKSGTFVTLRRMAKPSPKCKAENARSKAQNLGQRHKGRFDRTAYPKTIELIPANPNHFNGSSGEPPVFA